MKMDEHSAMHMWAPNRILLAGADFGLANILGKPFIHIKIGDVQESIRLENFNAEEVKKVDRIAQEMLDYTINKLQDFSLSKALDGSKKYQIRLLDQTENCKSLYERKAIFLEALAVGKAFQAFVAREKTKPALYQLWFKNNISRASQLAETLIELSKKELSLLIQK